MPFLRRRLLASLLALSLAGCGGAATPDEDHSEHTTGDEVGAPALDDVDHALLDAAGDHAAITVVFHPERWSVLRDFGMEVLGELFPDGLARVMHEDGPWGVARELGRMEGLTLPEVLAGWDSSRPILYAGFEPPVPTLDALVTHLRDMSPIDRPSHRIVIPATDPAALASALMQIGREVGDCEAAPATHARAFPDAAGTMVCEELLVVVEPGDGLVRLRAAELGRPKDSERFPPIPAALERATESHDLPVTPALRWAMTGDVVLAGYLRPSVARLSFLAEAHQELLRATADVEDGHVSSRQLIGAMEVLGAALRTSSVATEVDDVAFGIEGGSRPTMMVAQGLTPVGVQAYEAGLADEVPAEGRPGAPLVVRSRVNVDSMQASAGVPLGFGGIGDPDEAMRRFDACGTACVVHMLSARVYGLGALSDQTGFVRMLEDELTGPFLRVEPAELPPGTTMEITFDLPALALQMPRPDPFVRQIAEQVGVVHVLQARDGRVVMTRLRLGERPPLPEVARYARDDPGALGEAPPRDEAATCAERVIDFVAEGVRATSYGNVSNADEVLESMRAMVERDGACPGAPEELALIKGAAVTVLERIPPRPPPPPAPTAR